MKLAVTFGGAGVVHGDLTPECAELARLSPGSAGHASIHSVHMRIYRAPVTAARLLDGARSLLGHQTRYAAVGCHHVLQVLQPTR